MGWFLALLFVSPLAWGQGGAGSDWPSYGGTLAAWRYSELDQIHSGNVSRLRPAWVFQTGDYDNALQATPIIVDGIIYVSTANAWVFALDGATGKLIWEFRQTLRHVAPYGKQNRGVAVGHGRVFVGTPENDVVALDAKSGLEVWRVRMEDPRQCGCNITGAPLVIKEMVVAGVTGGDSAHRGYLTALDVKTGRLRWRFYTIPAKGEKGNETWAGDTWKLGGGATWMTGSYDAEQDLLYWGVGNPASNFNAELRQGANLYTNSIVALDPDDGKLRWHYQTIPQDVWDFDAAYEVVLLDITENGRRRSTLLHPGKSGFTWVLDRQTGEFLKAWPFVSRFNWITGIGSRGELLGRNEPVFDQQKEFCPGPIGGKSWNQGAYSPQTGWLYLPVLDICGTMQSDRQEAEEGHSFFGGSFTISPAEKGKAGAVVAFDPLTGERKWSSPVPTWLLSSVLATAGGLVFTGTPEGEFLALSAKTGDRLWSFQTGAGHRGSAVSYAVHGRQYIATPTGWGSIVGRFHTSMFSGERPPRAGSTLFVFALESSAK